MEEEYEVSICDLIDEEIVYKALDKMFGKDNYEIIADSILVNVLRNSEE